jgi:hypothetical protein
LRFQVLYCQYNPEHWLTLLRSNNHHPFVK